MTKTLPIALGACSSSRVDLPERDGPQAQPLNTGPNGETVLGGY
jgi:hypothetical protein